MRRRSMEGFDDSEAPPIRRAGVDRGRDWSRSRPGCRPRGQGLADVENRVPARPGAVIVLTNLSDAPYEGLAASIAIGYAPELKTQPSR
jgi:hypothetical protein